MFTVYVHVPMWIQEISKWNNMGHRELNYDAGNQLRFVESELLEFMEAKTIGLQLDGLLDVFVTAYKAQHYKQINPSPIIEEAKHWDYTYEHAMGIALDGLAIMEEMGINARLGMELVIQDNYRKFVRADNLNAIRATFDMYAAQRIPVYMVTCKGNTDYVVFLHGDTDKIMKPAGFNAAEVRLNLAPCFHMSPYKYQDEAIKL